MKLIAITAISFLFFQGTSRGQERLPSECPLLETATFNVFIPGYSDTTLSNGFKARVIKVAPLRGGFELLSDDNSVKVKSFHLVCTDKSGTVYTVASVGNKMTDNGNDIDPLSKLETATLITIDNIRVEYKGLCYTINGQVYYPH